MWVKKQQYSVGNVNTCLLVHSCPWLSIPLVLCHSFPSLSQPISCLLNTCDVQRLHQTTETPSRIFIFYEHFISCLTSARMSACKSRAHSLSGVNCLWCSRQPPWLSDIVDINKLGVVALPRRALAPGRLLVAWEAFSHGSVPGSCWLTTALLCWAGKGQGWHLHPSQALGTLSCFPSPALLACPANALQVFSSLLLSWETRIRKDQSENMLQGYKTEKWWFCPVWMKK